MPEIRVHELRVAEQGRWQFRGDPLTWHPPHRYGHTAAFDPMPAYPHDLAVTAAAAAHAAERCPPLWDVDLYVADREDMSRTNGYSDIHESGRYEGDVWVKETPCGLIMLGGKRTPPHPAFTRALTGHEYGHNVAFMLNSLRDDCKHVSSTVALERDYAAVRGLPASSVHHGEGGTWHDSACEIMACDFRLVVLGTEAEFWPHPGIERPEGIPAVRDWWAAAAQRLARARAAAEGAAA